MSEDVFRERQRVADDIRAARERVAACEGAKLQGELSSVVRMYRLFLSNEEELRNHFAKYDNPLILIELWDVNHRERFDAFLDETDRLLHNYLAAAGSLADHCGRSTHQSPRQITQTGCSWNPLGESHRGRVELVAAASAVRRRTQVDAA